MNNLFAAKLLQNLRKKKGEKGFTLIELLVVVIIIGVLAAVALPNLLGQVAKGRQAEAKNNLGAINRTQQAYRLEKARFGYIATNLGNTAATLPIALQPEFYTYTDVAAPTAEVATVNATAQPDFTNDILDYQAQATQNTTGGFASIICEETAINGTAPAGNGAAGQLANDCTGGNEVK